jgi:hypothetical protein
MWNSDGNLLVIALSVQVRHNWVKENVPIAFE